MGCCAEQMMTLLGLILGAAEWFWANLNRNQKKGKKSTSSRKLTSLLTRWMHILRTNDTSTKPFQSMASNAFSVFNNGKVLPIEGNNEIVVIGAPSGKNSQVQLIDDIRRSSFVN
eukprot:scaffold4358_cov177-Ochromonas_danica.AAC.9